MPPLSGSVAKVAVKNAILSGVEFITGQKTSLPPLLSKLVISLRIDLVMIFLSFWNFRMWRHSPSASGQRDNGDCYRAVVLSAEHPSEPRLGRAGLSLVEDRYLTQR